MNCGQKCVRIRLG